MVPRPLPLLPPPSPQRHEVGTGARVAELLQLLHTPLADTLLVAERLNVARINIAVAQISRGGLRDTIPYPAKSPNPDLESPQPHCTHAPCLLRSRDARTVTAPAASPRPTPNVLCTVFTCAIAAIASGGFAFSLGSDSFLLPSSIVVPGATALTTVRGPEWSPKSSNNTGKHATAAEPPRGAERDRGDASTGRSRAELCGRRESHRSDSQLFSLLRLFLFLAMSRVRCVCVCVCAPNRRALAEHAAAHPPPRPPHGPPRVCARPLSLRPRQHSSLASRPSRCSLSLLARGARQ